MTSGSHPTVPDEPNFDQLEAEGWTDLHLHPQDPQWSCPLDQLPAIAEALGVQQVGLLTLHSVEDLWDDDATVPDPLTERENIPLSACAELLQGDQVRHLSMVVDPAEAGFLPLMAQCQSRDWHACLLSLGWGLTTIPDADCRRTAARFRFSVAVGGPGVPAHYRQFAQTVTENEFVQQACERLAEILQTPCTATATFGD